MPLYEYECEKCGGRQTLQRPVSDRDVTTLPTYPWCCGAPMGRAVSRGTGLSFKGEGWARDGYGLKKGKSTPSGGEKS